MEYSIPALVANSRWFGWYSLACLFTFGQTAHSADTPLTSTNKPLVLWDKSARLELGGGYRANPTLSSIAPQGSSLLSIGGDASLVRVSESGSELMFFLLGESAEYLGNTSATGDRLLSASTRYNVRLDQKNQLLSEVYYLYQHQIMDVSESQAEFRPVLVEGNSVALRPGWKHSFNDAWSTVLEMGAVRQFYQGDLDDFWEPSLKGKVVRSFANRSELSVSLQTLHWLYDTRTQTDSQGDPILDTTLNYWRPEIAGQWLQYWDERRRWRTTLKTGWLWNLDNGSGYYDYNRFSLSAQLRWRNAGWTLSTAGRLAWYFYQQQYVLNELRTRSLFLIDARIERSLGKHWFLFASGEREWDFSNDPLDQYNDWQARGGLGYDF